MQTLVSLTDTSSPAKWSMLRFSFRCLRQSPRTSFHHQPEAQHLKSSAIHKLGRPITPSFEIVPLSDALAARGISYDLFRRAIDANSRNDGAGRVNQGEDSALVRIEGSIRTIEDIRQIVIDTKDGIPIRVKDVARVQIGSLTRYGAVTADGRGETVEGLVLGLRGANARQLVSDVRARLDELKPWLPHGVTINVFYDRSRLVD